MDLLGAFEHVTQKKTVFVVDDDPSVLRGLERLLTVHGFSADVFESIEDFCERANHSAAACLVLDIHMPGMSGIDFGRQLAKTDDPLPVIFITGNDNEATRKVAMEVGCIAYLPKPFPGKLLIEAIEKALDRTKAKH